MGVAPQNKQKNEEKRVKECLQNWWGRLISAAQGRMQQHDPGGLDAIFAKLDRDTRRVTLDFGTHTMSFPNRFIADDYMERFHGKRSQ